MILFMDARENVAWVKEALADAADLNIRWIDIAGKHAVVVNLVSMVDSQRVHDEFVIPLVRQLPVAIQTIEWVHDFDTILSKLIAGYTVVFTDEEDVALTVQISSNQGRSVEESTNEYVERGPRDGFTETWITNLGLIRKRIKSKKLQVKTYFIGTYTQTVCAMIFINGLAPMQLVDELKQKMADIRLDAVMDSSQLEQALQRKSYSPFEQLESTERPDKVVMALLEGKVAFLVDGSPQVLLLPTTLVDLFETTGDHYQRPVIATMRKLLRMIGFFMSTYLSSIYLSLVLYHSHLIPFKFVEILANKRTKVPFPAWFEIFVVQFMIDLAIEAIMRLPIRLGQIIGVAGAIVLGQAVISLNLIAPTAIVVVAITTVAGYVQPRLSSSFSISAIRYFNLFFASILGLYGVILTFMFWIIHLTGLNAFHTPYLRPISPFNWHAFRDAFVRLAHPWVGSKQHHVKKEPAGDTNE